MSQIGYLFGLLLSIFLLTWSCHAESHNQTETSVVLKADSPTLLPNPNPETLEATTGNGMDPPMDVTVNDHEPNANKIPSDNALVNEDGNQVISSGETQQPPDDGVFLNEPGNILNASETINQPQPPAQEYPLDATIEAHDDISEDLGTNLPLPNAVLKNSSNNTVKAPVNATMQKEAAKQILEQSQTTKLATLPVQPQPPNGTFPSANQTKPATPLIQPQPLNANFSSANQTKPPQQPSTNASVPVKAVKSSVTSPGKLEIIRGEGVRAPPKPTTEMLKPIIPEQSNSLKDHSIPQPVHPEVLKKDAVTVIKTSYSVHPPTIGTPSPSDSQMESTLAQILKGIAQTRVKVISDDRPLPDRKTSNSDVISKMRTKSEDDGTFKSYPAEDDMIFAGRPVRPLPTEGQQAQEVFPGVTLQGGKLEFVDSIRALEALKRLIEHKTSQGVQSPETMFPQSDLLNKRGSCVGAPLGCIRCSTLQPTTCSADDGLQGHCWDVCPSGCDPLQCVRCQRTCRI